jgi:hypothetical protein
MCFKQMPLMLLGCFYFINLNMFPIRGQIFCSCIRSPYLVGISWGAPSPCGVPLPLSPFFSVGCKRMLSLPFFPFARVTVRCAVPPFSLFRCAPLFPWLVVSLSLLGVCAVGGMWVWWGFLGVYSW